MNEACHSSAANSGNRKTTQVVSNNPPSKTLSSVTRNKAYEQRRKQAGEIKITIWVPEDTECDYKVMAERCCEDRDLYPAGLRSKSTGKIVRL